VLMQFDLFFLLSLHFMQFVLITMPVFFLHFGSGASCRYCINLAVSVCSSACLGVSLHAEAGSCFIIAVSWCRRERQSCLRGGIGYEPRAR